jgi:hypothetical protein
MPLVFPTSASINDTYQSGSSATYKWNGSYWIVSAPVQTGLTVATASYSERTAWVQPTPPGTGTGSLWYSTETGNTYIKAGTEWVPATNGTINSVSSSFAATASIAVSASFASASNSASFALTASAFIGSQAEYLFVRKSTSQTFGISYNNIINFDTPTVNTLVASSWNSTTGVFTAGRTATYRVGGSFIVTSASDGASNLYSLVVLKNSNLEAEQVNTVYTDTAVFKPIILIPILISVVAGDTLRFQWYQSINASRTNTDTARQNYITIEELPTRIQR